MARAVVPTGSQLRTLRFEADLTEWTLEGHNLGVLGGRFCQVDPARCDPVGDDEQTCWPGRLRSSRMLKTRP